MPTSIAVLDGNGNPQTVATIDALAALLGEVQASPTSNTLLDRLKQLHTDLTAGATPAGTAIIGKVGIDQTTPGTTNGVQVNAALPAGANVIGAVKTDQTTHGTTDLVAADLIKVAGAAFALGQALAAASLPVVLPATQEASLKAPVLAAGTAVVGKVGIDQTTPGITNLVAGDITKLAGTAVDVNSGNKSAGTIRVVLATDQPNLTTPFNVSAAAAASELHLGEVGGNGTRVSASFVRPSNTTAYTAKDVVSDSTSAPTVLTFSNFARVNAGSGYITKVRLMTDQIANTARYRLHLFHTTPTAINDNSPYLLLWANRSNKIGFIDLPACQTEDPTNSTAAYALNDTERLHFVCAAASRVVYGVVETLDAFTPASGQNFFVELSGDLN